MNNVTTDILIVGAGPAGIAAAAAASVHVSVTVVDDNPFVGGQIWRAELGRTKSKLAEHVLAAVAGGHIKLLTGVRVHSAGSDNELVSETNNGALQLSFEKLIIVTGARERFLPFPGWTLPNVMGAGGLQALVKGGLDVTNKRVVVAGTGPLLLAVAEYLKRKGAIVVAVAEQTSAAKLNRFGLGLISSPSKLKQAIALKTKLLGVPYLTDCWVTSANGNDSLESVELTRHGKTWSVECDFLAYGFHLIPNLELAELLGCRIENNFVAADDLQMTSTENVYCAGEPTGVAGIESALVEGEIAGLAASGKIENARKLFSTRDKAKRFGAAIETAFALRDELRSIVTDETIVCRCEDVEYGRLTRFDNFRKAKLQTRCGMGPCQGRICGGATQFLFGWERPSMRPPIFPVKMENL
jgi:NADPH-dependent 2,4-dienoyl-CoA reductase/sulfur reductase-like enzyme